MLDVLLEGKNIDLHYIANSSTLRLTGKLVKIAYNIENKAMICQYRCFYGWRLVLVWFLFSKKVQIHVFLHTSFFMALINLFSCCQRPISNLFSLVTNDLVCIAFLQIYLTSGGMVLNFYKDVIKVWLFQSSENIVPFDFND